MPRKSPFTVDLTQDERRTLEAWSRQYTLPYRDVIRARLVLMAADGRSNDQIASALQLPRPVVSKWRKRFVRERLPGLEDRPRRGRPPGFPPGSGL